MIRCLPQEDWKKVSKMFTTPSKLKLILLPILLSATLNAENLDDIMEGFDDAPTTVKKVEKKVNETIVSDDLMDGFDDEVAKRVSSSTGSHAEGGNQSKKSSLDDFTGKVTEQLAYSYSDDTPHDKLSSLKSSLLLDYEHKFENGFKFKTNGKAYYDAIYSLRGRNKYSNDELNELESEVELFDAYIEGSISDNLDMKLGRQVVVWGRSDTIRVTDVLNPLDNRRPGMVDIEDLRLPVGMAKLDYFVGDWRITPMAIFEQRFSKNPPSGSAFNPSSRAIPANENYSDVTPALSIGAEFSGWDVNFYGAKVRDDAGYLKNGTIQHDKVTMLGTAVNVLQGSWLLKSELAHFDGLKYSSAPNKEFTRTDALLGVEYNGFADTMVSYDVALKKIHSYDARLKNESVGYEANNYQHAFRISKDFMNATVKGNYLLSLFGASANKGGFQRAWLKYDIADGIYTNVGIVDYIGGSRRFDAVKNNDMFFADVTYSF